MAAEPRVSARIGHLCCRFCGDALRDPVTGPCGHNFCVQCIQGCRDRDGRTSCPDCGRVFASRPQPIVNTTVRDKASCTDDSAKRNRQDAGASPRAPKRPRSCAEGPSRAVHDRPLDAYCRTDGHGIVRVKLERRRKQEDLKILQRRCRQILDRQKEKRADMAEVLKQIEVNARRTDEQCEIAVCGAIDSLQRLYMSVKKKNGAQAKAATARARAALQTVEAKIGELERRVAELDGLSRTESDVRFLQEWPALQQLCEKDQHQQALREPLLPFEFTKRAVEGFVRRLGEICDKELGSIFQTAESGEQQESTGESEEEDTEQECDANISQYPDFSRAACADVEQNTEPTTRAQFLQYACELTLDPTTAHDDLEVSAGDKEVRMRMSPHTNKTTSVHMSEQFLRRRQVLCREGLRAERCYYEVEVEGDKVEIALTYKRIDRKSRNSLSAFGGNEFSWSLDRSKRYSVSHNGVCVALTTPPSHPRIGIYLKFREGTLSFYEVSDSMSMKFLYKDEAEFTESLFPGFWLGEKCHIRICNLRQ